MPEPVIPAKAGIHSASALDTGFRQCDDSLQAVLLDQALAISMQQALQLLDLPLDLAPAIGVANAQPRRMGVDEFHFRIDVEFLGNGFLRRFESLVRGQLYEDIRNAVHEIAKPEDYDAVVVINLCVPTASGVPLDLLPKEIDGVRIIGRVRVGQCYGPSSDRDSGFQ